MHNHILQFFLSLIARTLAYLEPLNALGYIWYVMYFLKEASNGASLYGAVKMS